MDCANSRLAALDDAIPGLAVSVLHRYLGVVIVLLFLVIMTWGVGLRIMGRRETPTALLACQHWTENLLGVQIVLGLVMLVIGRRVTGTSSVWLHYFYGSLFPLVAVVAGRIAALRREEREYVGLIWGSFIALALVLRSMQIACGDSLAELARCVGL